MLVELNSFPIKAPIIYCLKSARTTLNDLDVNIFSFFFFFLFFWLLGALVA